MSALASEIGLKQACASLGVPRSQFYPRARPVGEKRENPRALSETERLEVRQVLNSERFRDHAPRQVYAQLLDEGQYLVHWRSMYRILHHYGEVKERRLQRRHPVYVKPELLATGPQQVWSWDISKLRGTATWTGYALYTVLDIFSRYVVGWMIAECESAELARHLVDQTCLKQGIQRDQLILHADNGSPMKGQPLVALLERLGVARSHSRPHTSNDNPFSEAQFRTMKYHATYPKAFASLEDAQVWARGFFQWYNEEHYHSGLSLLTPASVHHGEAENLIKARQIVMDQAYATHPERFPKGLPQVATVPTAVYINPPANLL